MPVFIQLHYVTLHAVKICI